MPANVQLWSELVQSIRCPSEPIAWTVWRVMLSLSSQLTTAELVSQLSWALAFCGLQGTEGKLNINSYHN